ncbi:MAG TPA: hypothetical protein VN680_06460 [Burkholderiaceae bacterium]|jgi:predicted deacylase|nr:hypothetical protein [Burkholderiaceae bacterium]
MHQIIRLHSTGPLAAWFESIACRWKARREFADSMRRARAVSELDAATRRDIAGDDGWLDDAAARRDALELRLIERDALDAFRGIK